MCKKRKVNLIIDPDKLNKLTQFAKTYEVHRTDLIRLANTQLQVDISLAKHEPPQHHTHRITHRPSQGLASTQQLTTSEFAFKSLVSRIVSEKVLRFQGKSKDLNQLSQQIVQYLQNGGYKVQSTTAPMGFVIQAQKAGILRDIITADRAFTVTISGQPNDFAVHIGIGKWIQNLAVAAVESLFLSALFLAVDVPEMLWTRHVENEIVKEITRIVG